MKPLDRIESVKGVDRFFLNHKEVTEAEYRRVYPKPKPTPRSRGESLVGWKKLASESEAVHPDQVQEAIADSIAKGVPTHFNELGQPVFESRGHRKRYMQAYGRYDKDAGYSDAQRGSYRGKRFSDLTAAELKAMYADDEPGNIPTNFERDTRNLSRQQIDNYKRQVELHQKQVERSRRG